MDITGKFSESNCYYFWKGRVALYAILQALGISKDDEVVVPGFTCVVVPNAVIYSGARPVYADICPRTFNVTVDSIARAVTEKTSAIIVQSTFGLSPDLDPIIEFARAKCIPVIDDCTHGMGGSYKGQANGFITDASFFSFQWSKPISAGLGGIGIVRGSYHAEQMEMQVARCSDVGFKDDFGLMIQRHVRPIADIPAVHYPAVKLYRWATQTTGIVAGSSSGDELVGASKPVGYLKKCGRIQRKFIDKQLPTLPVVVKKRQAVALSYDSFFESRKYVDIPYRPSYADHGMLRYSVKVDSNAAIYALAKKKNIPLGDWFTTPLYPIYKNLERWGYKYGSCPVAEDVCNRVINLPTDKPLSQDKLETIFPA